MLYRKIASRVQKLSDESDKSLTLTLNYLKNGTSIEQWLDVVVLMTVVFRFLFCRPLYTCKQIEIHEERGAKDFFFSSAFPYNAEKKTLRIARYPVMASG